ncbi:MAG TPA: hypothetical protein VEP90_27410 [Methylomirabilota bacterium]|nr:hypothetical protein [Methylomirabilota bacterium]
MQPKYEYGELSSKILGRFSDEKNEAKIIHGFKNTREELQKLDNHS